MTNKINIAILAGGDSSEYFISLKSAEAIAGNLNKEKYNVYIVLIKGSEWTLTNNLNCGLIINKDDFSFNDKGQKVKFDIVFPAVHGTPGENGLVQGYFEMLKIPVIGSNVLSSSLTFNKYYCNTFLRHFNIVNIAKSLLVKKEQVYNVENIINYVGLPCFVKPDAGGSSFGISKVKETDKTDAAIEEAFKESDSVIIEQYIPGIEISCGFFKANDVNYPLPPAEIVSKNEFFDYEAKYNSDYNEEIIPARITDEQIKNCQEITGKLYDVLNCSGIVRMDYILKDGEYWFLETNTIPGMTNESIVPKMIRKAGMTFSEVADMLIADALNQSNNFKT
ncbi:MAG: D-alanine--D-alanine ligase [Bacteroidales bacterium]|nr:D-alanine--D-alanine ligase [Bacteroidales bacterium]